MISLKKFREQFQDRLIEIHWRQWASLGVASQIEEEKKWVIDLEALISSTFFIGEFDKRLLSTALEWVKKNGEWLNSSRLKRIGKYFYKIDKGLKKPLVTQETFKLIDNTLKDIPIRGVTTEPNIQKPSLIQLYFRGVFGINARAEILLYLLSKFGGNSNQIAKEIYFDQKIVYRILERWTKTGFVEKGQERKYLLKDVHDLTKMLKLQSIPHYINWVLTFHFFDRILKALNIEPWSKDEYLLSSFFRDILDQAKLIGRPIEVSFPDSKLYKGSNYLYPFATKVIELITFCAKPS